MPFEEDIQAAVRKELTDIDLWLARVLVIAAAAAAGLTVVGFTWLTEHALHRLAPHRHWPVWTALLWTPLCTALIVWITRRFAPGAAGSGIPQVMASLSPGVAPDDRGLFVSLRLSLAKVLLSTWGLLAGLSLGREGPSVQIAAGVMHSIRRWLPRRAVVNDHGLLVAGGAAGIAAAFNTPLAGVMFAIEKLSRSPEQRSSGLLIAGIVLAGLIGVSVYGNSPYFGVIRAVDVGLPLLLPGLLVTLVSGLAGGLFSRLLVASLAGTGLDLMSRLRQRRPVAFAAVCGLAVAMIGIAAGGDTFGSGYDHTRAMIEGRDDVPSAYALLKFAATWFTAWSGVPGGIFAPSLSIGGAVGHDLAVLTGYAHPPTLIALGMAGFLAAATQAPLTSFIIVMEMVDGHAMVLTLMTCTVIATGVSRLLGPPLYGALAEFQLARLPRK
ncbi:MAG: chloride channel protein [Aquabacterium sp.]